MDEKDSLCVECKTNSVHIKKSQLCKKCYAKQYRSLNKNVKRINKCNDSYKKERLAKWRIRIKERFGDDLISDIEQARTNPFTTLQSIASKYGFTREYARQIFNRHFQIDYGSCCATPGYICDLSSKHDPRNKIELYKKGSRIYNGTEIELLFIDECKKYGFEISSPQNRSTDIIINGYNVEIKSASTPRKTIKNSKAEYFHYYATKNEVANNDFFALYRKDMDSFVIIPNHYDRDNPKPKSIFMSKHMSDESIAFNNYWESINRYDLLIRKDTVE